MGCIERVDFLLVKLLKSMVPQMLRSVRIAKNNIIEITE